MQQFAAKRPMWSRFIDALLLHLSWAQIFSSFLIKIKCFPSWWGQNYILFSMAAHTKEGTQPCFKCSSRSLTAPDIKPRYNQQELILAIFPIYADIPDQLVNRGTCVLFDPACFSNNPLTLNNAVTTVWNQAGLLLVSPRSSCSPLPGRESRESIQNPLKKKNQKHTG